MLSAYSIKYLESLTGIKAHTIRMWEKRYDILTPKRTKTNIRYYDNSDLKKLLNIVTLLAEGFKISNIATLGDEQIAKEVKKLLDLPGNVSKQYASFANDLILAALIFDKLAFEKAFNTSVLRYGFQETIEHILFPALKRVGVLWQSDEVNPAHEHFFSNLAKQKLFSAIDAIPEPVGSPNRCLLFLPDNEEHEIGLLYSYYLLLKAGVPAVYLGQRTPLENLRVTQAISGATHLLFFLVTHTTPAQINKYLKELGKLFPQQTLLLCGNSAYLHKLKLPSNCLSFNDPEAIRAYFR